jgi:hypothetical protein
MKTHNALICIALLFTIGSATNLQPKDSQTTVQNKKEQRKQKAADRKRKREQRDQEHRKKRAEKKAREDKQNPEPFNPSDPITGHNWSAAYELEKDQNPANHPNLKNPHLQSVDAYKFF